MMGMKVRLVVLGALLGSFFLMPACSDDKDPVGPGNGGDPVDTTPPTILSIEPASGTTIPSTTSALIITFSKPMDPNSLLPPEHGAELWWLMHSQDADVIWSQNHTVLTAGLPTPLPAGMPLWITFAGYADANGNVQHEATHWSVVVAGTADYYPVVDGRELVYTGTWEEGEEGETDPTDWGTRTDYQRFELQDGGIFHRVEYEDEDYQEAAYTEIMSRTATTLLMHGWIDHKEDGDQRFDFTDPLTYLRLPPAQGQTWSGTTDSPQQPGYTLTISGEWLERLDRIAVENGHPYLSLFWTNVWKARLEFSMSFGGNVLFSGFNEIYLAPGVGLVRKFDRGENPDGEWDRSDVWLVIPGGPSMR